MLKQEKWIFMSYLAVLVLLFLMSSTDLLIKDEGVEVYSVGVLLEGSQLENELKFQKGMDYAAREYHVDLKTVWIYEAEDYGDRVEKIQTMIQGGVDAIVTASFLKEEISFVLEQTKRVLPVIVVGGELDTWWATQNISIDYNEAGKELAKRVENQRNLPIHFFHQKPLSSSYEAFKEGAREGLLERGYETSVFVGGIKELMEEISPDGAIVMVLEEGTLGSMVEVGGIENLQVYGIGSANRVLNGLERDVITGVIVFNQFQQGYLSIQGAVEALNKGSKNQRFILEHFYIEKNDLWKKEYEKMLYPIE